MGSRRTKRPLPLAKTPESALRLRGREFTAIDFACRPRHAEQTDEDGEEQTPMKETRKGGDKRVDRVKDEEVGSSKGGNARQRGEDARKAS